MLDDRQLVERFHQGDQTAVDALVQRYYARVFNLACRLCGNAEDAQDIVSETFLRVYRSLPGFRGEAQFRTWLYSIVRNVYLTDRRKQVLRRHLSLEQLAGEEGQAASWQFADRAPGPEGMLEQQERAHMVQAALRKLSEAHRLMIVLYHFQHCSYEEIAEVMELPVGTVKSRLNRARLALKNELAAALTQFV